MSRAPRDDSLSIEDQQHIDRICLSFEDAWLAGQRPVMEQFLGHVPPTLRPALLGQLLLLELDYRRSLREDVRAEDYLARFPRMHDVVRESFHEALEREAPVRFLPGSRIGRYEVRKTLGSGAFAVVYLAWDPQLEREVAVKVPHRYLLADDSVRRQFLHEARMAVRVRHPRIVTLYDVNEWEGDLIYLVMQYVPGESLRERLRRGPLTPDEAAGITAQVADAMSTAHQTGVFHRDLKPSNILLDGQGEPYVCDFGLAVQVNRQREHRGEWAGTLAYMSPEQMRGQAHHLDGRADIWALGVIHYEMLTGSVPFAGETGSDLRDEILHREPRPTRQFDPRIPSEQERICRRCLAKEPHQRYPTAADMARDLRALQRPRRKLLLPNATLWALAALLLTILGLMALRYPVPDASASAPPLHGSLQLLVWGERQEHRQGLPLDHPEALPIRNGDRVRISVQLNHPVFLYVLWCDAQGVVMPVYPWQHGAWNERPAEDSACSALALPEALDDGWTMCVPQDGVETLLLLARHTPLPRHVDLAKLVAAASRPTLARTATASWFQNGTPLAAKPSAPSRPQRPAELQHTQRIPDPVLRMHRELMDVLQPHFEFVRAVSFPVQGCETEVLSSEHLTDNLRE